MKRIILKAGEEGRIQRGHPWVYGGEVETVLAGPGVDAAGMNAAELEAGECADVEARTGRNRRPEYLGRAIVNPASQIVARFYSPSKEGLDKGFFKRRIREALERRAAAGYDLSRDSCRIVFGEADFLPGLIIDRFAGRPFSSGGENAGACEGGDEESGADSWLAVQFLAFGMDARKEMILDALREVLPARGIIEKSAPVRELEGLNEGGGLLRGEFPQGGLVIRENGLLFKIDLAGGQKTGHYLDQRDNRRRAGFYAAMLAKTSAARGTPFRALDCCSYSGGFALHIARAVAAATPLPAKALRAESAAGAETAASVKAARQILVTALDVSATALNLTRENAALNGLSEKVETIEADVFDFLRKAERNPPAGGRHGQFSLIVLDPPPFAKNRAALENAMRGYHEINLRAIKLLEKGGVLITCSCSHAVDEGRFKTMISAAAVDAGARLIQLDFRYQPPDHPILIGYDESLYLKCGFYRKL